jgi:toxin CcdB
MARHDVHPTPQRGGRGYVLDVQAGLLSELGTRVVVPLLPLADTPKPMGDLNPVFEVEGEPHVMVTQAITSLAHRHDEITRALEILLTGF